MHKCDQFCISSYILTVWGPRVLLFDVTFCWTWYLELIVSVFEINLNYEKYNISELLEQRTVFGITYFGSVLRHGFIFICQVRENIRCILSCKKSHSWKLGCKIRLSNRQHHITQSSLEGQVISSYTDMPSKSSILISIKAQLPD